MRTDRIKYILRENLYNGANDSRIDSLKDFVKFCQRHLKLTNLPKIDLTNDKSKTTTYAHNDIAND